MEDYEDSHHGSVPDEVITEGLLESAMTQQMEQSVASAPDQTSEAAPGPAQEPTQEPALDDLEPQLYINCIQKIIYDKATGILVFPMWLTQAWFPQKMDLLVEDIVILNPRPNLVLLHSRQQHPLHHTLTLGAALLSGSPSLAAARPRPPRD